LIQPFCQIVKLQRLNPWANSMRYFLFDEFKSQWPVRNQYIFDVIKLWCYVKKHNNYIEFTSIPANTIDVLFLIGHNDSVFNYLKNNSATIHESIIVLITCQGRYNFKSLIPGKTVLICNQSSKNIADLYDKSQFEFLFDPTESELLFYNCPEKSICKRLELCFKKL